MNVYTADDREPGEFPTDTVAEVSDLSPQERFEEVKGGNPEAAALRTLWAERDTQYAKRAKYLTEEQIEAIRIFRYREACQGDDLDLLIEVREWYPPEHGQ